MHSKEIGRSFKTEKEMQQSKKLMWDSLGDNTLDKEVVENFCYRDTMFKIKEVSLSSEQYEYMADEYFSGLESGLEDKDIYKMDRSGRYFNTVRSDISFPGAVRVIVEDEELVYYKSEKAAGEELICSESEKTSGKNLVDSFMRKFLGKEKTDKEKADKEKADKEKNDNYTEAVEHYLNKKVTESVNNWQCKNKSILTYIKNDNSVLVIDKSDSERNPLLAVGIGSDYNCIYAKCKWYNQLNKDNEGILEVFLSTAFRILENLGIKETEPSNEIKNIISSVTLSINFPGITATFKPLEVDEKEKILERVGKVIHKFIIWGGHKSILLFDTTEIGSKSLDFVQIAESFFESLGANGINMKRVYLVKPIDLDKENVPYVLSEIPQKVILRRNPNGKHINDIMGHLNRFKDSGKHEEIDGAEIDRIISRLSMELEWANNESTGSVESYLEGLQRLSRSHKINIARKLLITPYGEYNTSSKWYYVTILIYLATLEVNNYDEEEAKRCIKSVNSSLIKSIWSESKFIHNLI